MGVSSQPRKRIREAWTPDVGAEHEVIDVVYSARPRRAVGDKVQLIYPEGRPYLARISRPALWVMVYGVLVFMAVVLAALVAG